MPKLKVKHNGEWIEVGGTDPVQSDWSQNDETAADYVKNRTHYEEIFSNYTSELSTISFTECEEYLGMNLVSPVGIFTFESGKVPSICNISCVGLNSSVDFNFNEVSEWKYGGPAFDFVLRTTLLDDGRVQIDLYTTVNISGYGFKITTFKNFLAIDEKFIPLTVKAGRVVAGETFTVNGIEVIANNGAEIFNNLATNKAIGVNSHAEGQDTLALGYNSHAEGTHTTASGDHSHTEGYCTIASGESSHAEGESSRPMYGTITSDSTTEEILTAWESAKFALAKGRAAHTEGSDTLALGNISHAEGGSTIASGMYSHAEGWDTIASGYISHAEGYRTIASGQASHAQGQCNIEDTENKYAHIVGNGQFNTARSNAHTLDWDGNAWFAGDVYVGSTSGTNKDDGSKKLATEEYTDNKVIGLATETFVTNKISEAQLGGGGNVDLSGYVSKDDVIDIAHGGTNAADAVTALDNLGALNLDFITDDAHMIASGDDLNSYTTPGAYRCASGAIATSLVNAPSSYNSGFRLVVSAQSATTGVVQLAVYNSIYTKICIRTQNGEGNWGAWQDFAFGTNKVFNKLTDIGITTFPTTMKTVANSMPANSTLMLDSRDIIAGGTNEISDLGNTRAGMYMFMRGNSNARLSLLNIYGATSATTSYLMFGCYAATNDAVTWIETTNAANHNVKTYSDLSQLGLSGGVTTNAVFVAMPVGSMLTFANSNTNGNYLTDRPTNYCSVVVFKSSTKYGTAIATRIDSSSKETYVYDWYSGGSHNDWSQVGNTQLIRLWENGSPTSSFAAQTVLNGTDLSSYDAVLVLARLTDDTESEVPPILARIDGPDARLDTLVNGVLVRRVVTATSTGVQFGAGGKYMNYNNASVSTDNTKLIPTFIYGVRGVK